jgi:hypothetical protein
MSTCGGEGNNPKIWHRPSTLYQRKKLVQINLQNNHDHFFLNYIVDIHNARTHIPMHARTQTLTQVASMKIEAPRGELGRCLPIKV